MLLTLDNLANRSQYINAKNTFEELLRCACWAGPVGTPINSLLVKAGVLRLMRCVMVCEFLHFMCRAPCMTSPPPALLPSPPAPAA